MEEEDVPFDANNEDKRWLGGNVERAVLLAQASETDLLTLSIAVLLDVGFSALEDDLALFFVGLFLGVSQELSKLRKSQLLLVKDDSDPKDG